MFNGVQLEKTKLVNFIKQFHPLKFSNKIIFLLSFVIFLISFFTINLTFGQSSDFQDLVISADLSKNDFISGESIFVSTQAVIIKQKDGIIFSEPYKGKLKIHIIYLDNNTYLNSSNIKDFNSSIENFNMSTFNGTLMQSKEFFINGSLTDYIFDAPNSIGRYAIIFESFPNPFDINSNSNKSVYYFNVIYPWFTNWGISFIIVLVSIAGLTILIFLSTQTMEKIKLNFLIFKISLDLTDITTFEIIRFILISIIILPSLFGLIFIDSEWGRNSIISIIKLYNTTNEEQLDNQWIVNIGGLKIDNYQSGIFIPVFVIIFGLIGGYLRYLHRTILQKDNIYHSSYVDEYLFSWNDIIGNIYEGNKLKQYLNNKLKVNWIYERNFEMTPDNQIKIDSPDKKDIILIQLNRTLNRTEDRIDITFDGELVDHTLIGKRINDQIFVYNRLNKKNWLFYQSLGDMTILVMAPLLAIATWFLLNTAGVYDKYIIAIVSLTIGLITENIINRLINFSESAFKGK